MVTHRVVSQNQVRSDDTKGSIIAANRIDTAVDQGKQ